MIFSLLISFSMFKLVNDFIKRLFDIVSSSLAIVILSPLWVVVSIMITCDSKGPVFFRKGRRSKDGRVFEMLKFRSMVVDAEKKGAGLFNYKDDPRVTKVGRFLRDSSIDELPQLFNILKGDMTFVGPRPERPELFDEIVKDIPEFRYRLTVKAGLTGYAQIYGKYNTSMRDKLLLDIYYIENYSLISDIRLMVMTLKVVLIPESTEGVKE